MIRFHETQLARNERIDGIRILDDTEQNPRHVSAGSPRGINDLLTTASERGKSLFRFQNLKHAFIHLLVEYCVC